MLQKVPQELCLLGTCEQFWPGLLFRGLCRRPISRLDTMVAIQTSHIYVRVFLGVFSLMPDIVNGEVMKHFVIVISVGIMACRFHPLWPTNARGVQMALTGENGAAATKHRRQRGQRLCVLSFVWAAAFFSVPPTCPNSHFL